MNSRQRVEMALNFEQPDRTPFFASFVPEIDQLLRSVVRQSFRQPEWSRRLDFDVVPTALMSKIENLSGTDLDVLCRRPMGLSGMKLICGCNLMINRVKI